MARRIEYRVSVNGVQEIFSEYQWTTFGPRWMIEWLEEGKKVEVERIVEEDDVCDRCGCDAIVAVSIDVPEGAGAFCHKHRIYKNGHVLRGMGLDTGSRHELDFAFCVCCGTIQGEFPKKIHGAIVCRDTCSEVK